MENFKHRFENSIEETLSISKIIQGGDLTNFEINRLNKIKDAWNFYEGYHWEGIDDLDVPQVTFNYIRPFVNKFVAFEFGKGFTFKTNQALDKVGVTVNDNKLVVNFDRDENGVITSDEKEVVSMPKTLFDFLSDVWKDNKSDVLITELGQTKSITGDAWVKVQYFSLEDLAEDDPFGEYENGRIRLVVMPTQYVFPTFNEHDRDKLESMMITYPIKKVVETGLLRKRAQETTILYKEIWDKDSIKIFEDGVLIETFENPYGLLPFVQFKNFVIAGRTYGASDVEDLIPLNVELNTKKSDVSEVIDYHSAPITLVYGAKIGNLEKGANKVWGGLPKDSRVENLSLQGDLIASVNYTDNIKTAMCEIGGIPETVLGGAQAISNTSGVALQYMNLPLVERTRVKRLSTKEGLEKINKMIIFIALQEGLIIKPDNISLKDFLHTEVTLPDTLPKDELIELQLIEQEMRLGLECRHGAMTRTGKDDVTEKLAEIDEERQKYPEIFNPQLQAMMYEQKLNSGMLNSQTPNEQVRIETTGSNGLPIE